MTSLDPRFDSHLDDERISSWLAGADDASLAEHVRECSACAARLQTEAVLDVELHAVRDAIVVCPGCAKAHAKELERCDFCGVAFAPGGYVVDAVLAAQDHSRLYRARDEHGRFVALKELCFANVPDVAALDAFDREAALLRQLRHPQIPLFVASFHEGEGVHERLYLVQELVDGVPLAEVMRTTRFDEARARQIAKSVLAVLVHLQSRSPTIIHRDIKPENLLERPDGKLVLVDFGAARERPGTMGATVVGTFGYMPPEQLAGVVDASTDVYALAATLVHLLTRRAPWDNVADERWKKELHASPRFVAFLAKCLASQRERRFRDAAEALAALEAPPRRSLARPIAAAALGACVLAGGTAAVAHFTQTVAPPPAPMTHEATSEATDGATDEATAPPAESAPPLWTTVAPPVRPDPPAPPLTEEGAYLLKALNGALLEARVPGSFTSVDCSEAPCIAVGRIGGTVERFEALFETKAAARFMDLEHDFSLYGVEMPEHPVAVAFYEREPHGVRAVHDRVHARMKRLLSGTPVGPPGTHYE